MKFSLLNTVLLTLICILSAAWYVDRRRMLSKVKAEGQRQNDILLTQHMELIQAHQDIAASSDLELRRKYALGKDYSGVVNEIMEKP